MATATLRVSELDLRWNALSNRVYQVQYQTEDLGGAWINLGPPMAGTNGVQTVVDRVRAEDARRFYRVLTLPQ